MSEILLVDNLRCVIHSQQALLVTTSDYHQVDAHLEAFEITQGRWELAFAPIRAVIGKNGFTHSKVEGDGASPIGVYSLGCVFGRDENPGTRQPYRQTTPNDFWVDDPESFCYNTWQVAPAFGRWKSAELLRSPGRHYRYAVVINYNTGERIPGRGSAVFLHVWDGPGIGTEGCTAVECHHLLRIIRWLDPSKRPLIIMGPLFEVVRW